MIGNRPLSEELLNDSVFDLPSYIAREFARRIGAAEEDAFFNGNGTGKPLGILASTGGAETGVTAASATAITMDEVIDLFYSLRAPYRRNAVFIMNDSTVKAIRKLKNGNGDYYAFRIFHSGMATPVPVANGGTGARNAKAALSNLGIFYASSLPASGTDGQICLVPV